MLCFKELRKERGLSLKEMGDILGVSESCVSLYENEKREASYEVLRKASDFFGVSIDCLLRAERRPSAEHSSISVPLLQSVTLSQGQMDFTYTPQKKIIDFGAPSDYLYFKMHDTSMQPQIEKGDLVLIRRQAAVTNNDLAAVIFKDSPVGKGYRKLSEMVNCNYFKKIPCFLSCFRLILLVRVIDLSGFPETHLLFAFKKRIQQRFRWRLFLPETPAQLPCCTDHRSKNTKRFSS